MSSIVETPLAEENLGLVHLCANRFRNRGIEYDDLYGAGCIFKPLDPSGKQQAE